MDPAKVNKVMVFAMARRMLTEPDPRALGKTRSELRCEGIRSGRAVQEAAAARREYFPPFLFLSVISVAVSLRCQGCWVDVAAESKRSSSRRR